jgi:hypothetical protein
VLLQATRLYHQSVPKPEAGQRATDTVVMDWQGLPPEQQAALLVEMVQRAREGNVCATVLRELGLDSTIETVNSADQPIPTNWVHKDDLTYCRPDLAERIEALGASEVKYIAGKIGDALQDTYWVAMGIILDDYLGSQDTLK